MAIKFSFLNIVVLQPAEDNLEAVCSGENLRYTCTFSRFRISRSNLNEVQIGLTVAYPQQQPISITYSRSTRPQVANNLGLNTVSTLTEWSDSLIELSVTLTVPPSSIIEGTVLECSILRPIHDNEDFRIRPDMITIDVPAVEGMYFCVFYGVIIISIHIFNTISTPF